MASPRILVVEDEQPLKRILVYSFENEGYTVSSASDGIDCMNKLSTFGPDAIVMDIMMPKLDGLEAIKLVRQNQLHRHAVVVALSARAGKADREGAMKAGADLFMKKPFQIARLVETVEELLASRKAD